MQAPASRRSSIPAAYYLAALFLVISPLSLATELEGHETLKYARIAICFLGVLLAIGQGALTKLPQQCMPLFAFAAFYSISPLWSPFPLNGLIYRTVFLSSLLFGVFLGISSQSEAQLTKGMRLLCTVAVMASSIVLYQYLRSPTQFSRVGRLAAYGINANAIGMTAAGYALMAYYLAVFDKGRWRTIGIGGTAVLGLIILATGSRASLAMAVLGGTVLSIPLLKHPGRVLAVAIPLAGLLLAFSGDISAQAIERFGSLENTRSGMWAAGLRHFAASPVIGKGWLSWGRSTANLQNMYLQILAEGGLIGGLLFGAAALAIINLAMSAYRGAKNVVHPTTYLALAFLVSLSVHAVAESALLLGSTVNTLFFGMAIGLLSVSKTQHTSAYRAAVRLSPASRPA